MFGRLVTLWLGITAARQLALAWLLYSERSRYEQASSFLVALETLPMTGWAALWCASGLVALAAIASRRLWMHLVAGILVTMLTGYWTLAFVFASVELRTASKLLAVVFGALTLKDMLLVWAMHARGRGRPV